MRAITEPHRIACPTLVIRPSHRLNVPSPEAWAACRRDLQPPEVAMRRYVSWVKALPGKPLFVGYPASFDFMFVNWYLM